MRRDAGGGHAARSSAGVISAENPAKQHAGEAQPCRGRGLEIVVRLEVVRERLLGRPQALAGEEGGGGAAGEQRDRAGAEEGQAEGGEAVALADAVRGQANDGVIAGAAGQLGEAGAGAGSGRVDLDRDQQFVGGEGGGEQALEELGGRDRAAATCGAFGDDAGVEGEGAGGELGGRVGIGEGAAEGAAGADGGVGDVRRGAGEQRRGLGDQGRGEQLGVPGERAKAEGVALAGEAAEFRQSADVDQQ